MRSRERRALFLRRAQRTIPLLSSSSRTTIATPSPDSDHWHLQRDAQSASRLRLSTPRRRYPVVEMMKSYPDSLPNRQRARETETERWQDDHQRRHRRPNPRRHQRNPKESTMPSRSLTPHLRTGWKNMMPSRRCTSGHHGFAKWKEIDPRVRDAYPQLESPTLQLTCYYLSMLRIAFHRLSFSLLTRAE